jgi:formylglycine-generating enzyme required for sulfatase activity
MRAVFVGERRISGKAMARCLFAVALLASAVAAQADVFNMSGTQTSLQFVTVGNPGNAADTTGYGAVPYNYQMGKYDVTAAEYCDFLNAVATTADPYGLYTPSMAPTGVYTTGCGIVQTSGSAGYTYSVLSGWANMPANYVSWGDAARFCNWLQNGQTLGPEGLTTTETGAYTLNGATTDGALMSITRNTGATYFIPSENEWYKAAYYDPTLNGGAGGYWTYPTKSNSEPSNAPSPTGTNNANYFDVYSNSYTDPTNYLTPVGYFAGSPGPYGTYDMGGDVFQWTEAIWSPWYNFRELGGGSFYFTDYGLAAGEWVLNGPGGGTI